MRCFEDCSCKDVSAGISSACKIARAAFGNEIEMFEVRIFGLCILSLHWAESYCVYGLWTPMLSIALIIGSNIL